MNKLLIIVYFQIAFSQHPHSHANREISFPDIKGWPSIRVAEAQKDGLDAIAVTEHIEYQSHIDDIPHPDRNRSYELAKKYAGKSNLIVVNGTEITKNMPPGHSNAIFVKDVNKIMNDDYMEAYKAARKQGAFIFWNHPHWIGQSKDGTVNIGEEVKE